jgi:tyrosine-protein kinase Etk/Wzc
LCLFALVGSVGIALLLSNYYQATTIFYAASADLFKADKIFGTVTQGVDYYGAGPDIDRILTIGQSQELVTYMVKKFNLNAHYDIDTSKQDAPFKVSEAFLKLYNIQKTKLDAIELTVEDKDPKFAAQMATEARKKISDIAERLIKDSQQKMISTFEENISYKQHELITMGDSLQRLRKIYGIYNAKAQSEALTTLISEAESKLIRMSTQVTILEKNPNIKSDTVAMMRAMAKGFEEEVKSLTSVGSKSSTNLPNFNKGVGVVQVLEQLHEESSKQLGYNLEKVRQLKSAYATPTSAIHLIEEAAIPIVKSRPKRSIIVLVCVFVALAVGILTAILLDVYKNVDWKAITQEEA